MSNLDEMIRKIAEEVAERVVERKLSTVQQNLMHPAALREKAGYACTRDAAIAAGISVRALQRYESGRWKNARREMRDNWTKLARVYGVDPKEFERACFAHRRAS